MYHIKKHPFEESPKHFWGSDFHVFHNPNWEMPIWRARGYSSEKDAAEKILNKINERVNEDSILWYLGDMFLNAPSDEECLEWLQSINCTVKYVFGNHESVPYRLYRQEVKKQYDLEGLEIYPLKMGNVEFVGNHVEIRMGRQHIVMNHYPIHSWNKMGRHKSWMLSGHQHNSDPTRNPEFPLNKCLDVGWDWKKDIWSYEEIEDVMSTKTFKSLDHHDSYV